MKAHRCVTIIQMVFLFPLFLQLWIDVHSCVLLRRLPRPNDYWKSNHFQKTNNGSQNQSLLFNAVIGFVRPTRLLRIYRAEHMADIRDSLSRAWDCSVVRVREDIVVRGRELWRIWTKGFMELHFNVKRFRMVTLPVRSSCQERVKV